MEIVFQDATLPEAGLLAVGVYQGAVLGDAAGQVNEACGGQVKNAMDAARFEGKGGSVLSLYAPGDGRWSRVLLVGLGAPEDVDSASLRRMGGTVVQEFLKAGAATAAVVLDTLPEGAPAVAEAAAEVACGARLGAYRFDRYRTTRDEDEIPSLDRLHVHCSAPEAAGAVFAPLSAVVDGVLFTRDLVSEPANVLSPEALVAEAETHLAPLGCRLTVLDEGALRERGLHLLLAVGQGSTRESRLLAVEWRGADEETRPVAVVGKGVCFDSGGISIKPSANMEDMKWDMGGAGVVLGLMKALAGRKARANVIGVVGAVENMPDGNAQRPGDVVTSLSGQTVEVINTDAEGRLVLADALTWVQQEYDPQVVVDLATLTGAIIIALGAENAGLFSNDDSLAKALLAAGTDTGEGVWRLPLGKEYDELIKSDIADMKNVGGREAGAVTAAQFLKRYIDNGRPWAHLDIAGVTWGRKDKPTRPKGGTGYGVALLDRWVAEHYES